MRCTLSATTDGASQVAGVTASQVRQCAVRGPFLYRSIIGRREHTMVTVWRDMFGGGVRSAKAQRGDPTTVEDGNENLPVRLGAAIYSVAQQLLALVVSKLSALVPLSLQENVRTHWEARTMQRGLPSYEYPTTSPNVPRQSLAETTNHAGCDFRWELTSPPLITAPLPVVLPAGGDR